MEERLGKLKVAELKQRLGEIGAVKTGRKRDLINRLILWDRNNNFSGPSITLPEQFPIPSWPNAPFQQLSLEDQENIPNIRDEHIQQYVVHRQCLDRGSNYDHSALKRGKLMQESVGGISFLVQEEKCFISCMVSSAMRDLGYNVSIVLDTSGEVNYSHCECTVGVGPHGTCKHAVSILQSLVKFKKGEELNVSKSCTDTLQSFNTPKKSHRGGPVTSDQLQGPKISKKKKKDDPRDPRDIGRAWNRADLENKTTAFCFYENMDIAHRYTYRSANLQLACLDHDYLKSPYTHY